MSLSLPKTHRIALDVRRIDINDEYQFRVYRGVIRYAREHAHWELLYNDRAYSLTARFERYEDLAHFGADGLICGIRDRHELKRIQATGLPVVDIFGCVPAHDYPIARPDDIAIGRLAARHFLDRGFRSLAFCGPNSRSARLRHWATLRWEGFDREARDAGLTALRFQQQAGDQPDPKDSPAAHERRRQRSAERFCQWVGSLPKPVGVMAAHDERALHVLEACEILGLDVPGAVALVGVDNNPLLCYSRRVSLSSVEPNVDKVGYEAAALMDQMLSRRWRRKRFVRIPPQGVVTRMSSDILAVEDPLVARALTFIGERFAQPIGVENVVGAVGVSRRNLEQRFQHWMSRTIKAELRRRRLERAKELLLASPASLEEIAHACGFRRATYLSNVFRREFGLAPGAWRRRRKPNGFSGRFMAAFPPLL